MTHRRRQKRKLLRRGKQIALLQDRLVLTEKHKAMELKQPVRDLKEVKEKGATKLVDNERKGH